MDMQTTAEIRRLDRQLNDLKAKMAVMRNQLGEQGAEIERLKAPLEPEEPV